MVVVASPIGGGGSLVQGGSVPSLIPAVGEVLARGGRGGVSEVD